MTKPYTLALSRCGVTRVPIRYGRFIRVRPKPWLADNIVDRAKVARNPDSIQLVQFTNSPPRAYV
jgi:hypothetical protein